MEGPTAPKLYRAPNLEVSPPRLQDAVGVFSGCRVYLEKEGGETLLVVERGSRRYLMKF